MSIEQLDTLSTTILDGLYRASWQGGIAAVLVWTVCTIFPRLPGTARSWLWRLVFLKMILAFIWVRPIELALLAPSEIPATQSQTAALISDAPQNASINTPALPTEPAPPFPRPLGGEGQGEGASLATESIQQPLQPVQPLEPTISISTPPAPLWSAYWKIPITALWLSGALCGLILLSRQFRTARKLRRTATRCTEERILDPFITLARAIGLVRLPEIRASTITTRPMLIGIIRPTLIFPEQLLATASSESLRMMIAHELAHIRRRDLAWTTLAAVLRTIFFFHPLVWLARRESLLAQELACDELALRLTSSATTRYAEMLVDVVSLPTSRAPALISLGVAETRKTLERRIRSMKFLGHKKTKTIRLLAALALFTALIALIPLRLVAAKPEVAAEKPRRIRSLDATEAALLLKKLEGKDRSELRRLLPTLLQDNPLNGNLRDLSHLERAYAALKEEYADDHPEVKRVAGTMAQINHFIDNRIGLILTALKTRVDADAKAELEVPAVSNVQLEFPAVRNAASPSPVSLQLANEPELPHTEVAPFRRDNSHPKPTTALARGDAARILNGLRQRDRSELRQILPTLTGDTLLTDYLKALSEAEQKYAAVQNDYSDEHPAVKNIQNVLQLINNQIEARIDGVLLALEAGAMAEEDAERDLRNSSAREAVASSPKEEPEPAHERPVPAGPFPVHARVGGTVEKVLVRVGETVKKGQVLLEIDNSPARSRLNSAEARAKIAEADLRIAKAEFQELQAQYANKKKLIETGLAPADSLPNLEKAQASIAKADAQAELALLERDQAKQELDRYILRAPIDGTISSIIHEGYFVPEGSGKILAEIRTKEGDRAARSQTLERLHQELARSNARLQNLLLEYTEKSPQVQNLRSKIEAIEERLREAEDSAPSDELAEEHSSVASPRKNHVQEVFVNGQVNKPGVIPVPPGKELTILSAIMRAGGFTDRANQNKIIFTRPGEDEKVVSFKDLKNPKNNIPLQPGDIIEVTDKLF
jgi:beta-lactamase regulating signal transducer with metallopeptidase domain/biotin carboxyl carrier protein